MSTRGRVFNAPKKGLGRTKPALIWTTPSATIVFGPWHGRRYKGSPHSVMWDDVTFLGPQEPKRQRRRPTRPLTKRNRKRFKPRKRNQRPRP